MLYLIFQNQHYQVIFMLLRAIFVSILRNDPCRNLGSWLLSPSLPFPQSVHTSPPLTQKPGRLIEMARPPSSYAINVMNRIITRRNFQLVGLVNISSEGPKKGRPGGGGGRDMVMLAYFPSFLPSPRDLILGRRCTQH